jgi:DNA-binding transcriptional MerR regulator
MTTTKAPVRFLGIREVAEQLGLSQSRVRQLDDILVPVIVSGVRIYDPSTVDGVQGARLSAQRDITALGPFARLCSRIEPRIFAIADKLKADTRNKAEAQAHQFDPKTIEQDIRDATPVSLPPMPRAKKGAWLK